VRDEQVRQAELVLKLFEEVDDLSLDRDVERRDGLVADDELWVQRQCASEADPLALAAGELVWVPIDCVARQAHDLEELSDPQCPLTLGEVFMHLHGLSDEPSDRMTGIEGSERVLEDHLHPRPQGPQLTL
jgi:hypothetical protein